MNKSDFKVICVMIGFVCLLSGLQTFLFYKKTDKPEQNTIENKHLIEIENLLKANIQEQKRLMIQYDSVHKAINPNAPKKLPKLF